MREILFRGKRKDNGKWVMGSLLIYADGDCFICCEELKNVLNKYQVIPSTVGQYTGLTDKNGKKIFEGDIVREPYYPENDCSIEWHDGRYHFRKRTQPKEWGYEAKCCIQRAVAHLKIIGNIYDNPELLEVKE